MNAQTILALSITAVVGITAGIFGTLLVKSSHESEIGRSYYIQEIVSYKPVDGNAMVSFHAYLEGSFGHVKTINCLLPLDTKLTATLLKDPEPSVSEPIDPDPNNIFAKAEYESVTAWHGIERIRIDRTAFHLEDDLYYCRSM